MKAVLARLAFLAVAATTIIPAAAEESSGGQKVANIVLVHGANTDGSAWKGVFEILMRDGFHVDVVQEPLTGLAEDVAATKRVIDREDGPVVLVGHSYGGTIITVAGADPKVRALVFVAALQPDVGETTNQLASSRPGKVSNSDFEPTSDGYVFVNPAKFPDDVAADLPPDQAAFMAHAQMPVAAAAFDARVAVASWHTKPSFAIVATADKALSPELARWMYKRSGAEVTEIDGSHLVHVSHPDAVARVIESAASRATASKPQAQ